MKQKLIILSLFLVLGLFAYNGPTHRWLAYRIPTILSNDDKTDVANLLNRYITKFADGSVWPDLNSTTKSKPFFISNWSGNMFRGTRWASCEHFEDPYSHNGVMVNFSPSTLIKIGFHFTSAEDKFFEYFYRSGAELYFNSDTAMAITWLGRAVHLLEDVNTPFHAKGHIIHVNPQGTIEDLIRKAAEDIYEGLYGWTYQKYCDSVEVVQDNYIVKSGGAYHSQNYDEVQWIRSSALVANAYRGYCDGVGYDNLDYVMEHLVPRTQRVVAGVVEYWYNTNWGAIFLDKPVRVGLTAQYNGLMGALN